MKLDYVFPNELSNRNEVAIPNKVWALDLTTLNQKIISKPECCIKLLVIQDLSVREVLAYKLFLVRNSGSIKPRYIIRILSDLLKTRKVTEELIIHTDRGSEFTSYAYFSFIKSNKFLIGSMSKVANPTDNAVVERLFRTLKSQLITTLCLPRTFDSLYQADVYLKRKIDYYNNEFISKSSFGLPKRELSLKLTETEVTLPSRLAHWKNNDKVHREINTFKEKVARSSVGELALNLLSSTKRDTLNLRQDTADLKEGQASLKYMLFNLSDKVETLSENLLAKKCKKHKPLPLRQPASGTIYEYLLSIQKPKGYSNFKWSRDRLAITLLFYLGLRAGELLTFSKEMLDAGLVHNKVNIYQSKTNSYRVVVFTLELRQKLLTELSRDVSLVFSSPGTLLGRSSYSGELLDEKSWLKSINAFMRPAAKQFNENLSTHSFRINFITKLLRKVPLQQVKLIVGHKCISTTQLYDRFQIDADDLSKTIDDALREVKLSK